MLYILKGIQNKNKTIISFDTTSDQGLIRDFQFVGIIIGTCIDKDNWRSRYYPNEFFYKVKIIISHNNNYKEGDIKEIPAWYCTIKDNIFIHTN